MIRRALVFAVGLVTLLAAPVAAQEYDGTSTETSIAPDGDIIVAAEGFEPNATVTYEVDYTPFSDENAMVVGGYEGEVALAMNVALPAAIVETGSTTADAQGNITFEVQNQGEGRYEIRMTDGVNTATAVAVVGEAGAGGDAGGAVTGGLPRTGDDTTVGLAQIGFVAVAIGAVAVYGARRRRAKSFS